MYSQPNYTYRDYDFPINLLLDIRLERTMLSKLIVLSDEYLDTLDDVLDTLPERTRTVILYRYKEQMTLDEIGGKLSVTSEMARQIVSKGLRLLRHPARRKHLITESNKETSDKLEQTDAAEKTDDPPITTLGLSARAKNCLLKGNMWTVSDVIKRSPEDLGQIRGMGTGSYREIIERMEALGYDMAAHYVYLENWKYV